MVSESFTSFQIIFGVRYLKFTPYFYLQKFNFETRLSYKIELLLIGV